MLLRVVHRRWYEFHSHHFSHAVRPCKPPVLLHGKATDRHRKTQYRAAQRFSAWVANRHLVQLLRSIRETKTAYLFRRVPLKKSRSLYFSCCLSGQMHGIRLRSAAQEAEVRSYPLRGCHVSLLPFALPRFRVSARVTPLSLGTGRQIDGL